MCSDKCVSRPRFYVQARVRFEVQFIEYHKGVNARDAIPVHRLYIIHWEDLTVRKMTSCTPSYQIILNLLALRKPGFLWCFVRLTWTMFAPAAAILLLLLLLLQPPLPYPPLLFLPFYSSFIQLLNVNSQLFPSSRLKFSITPNNFQVVYLAQALHMLLEVLYSTFMTRMLLIFERSPIRIQVFCTGHKIQRSSVRFRIKQAICTDAFYVSVCIREWRTELQKASIVYILCFKL